MSPPSYTNDANIPENEPQPFPVPKILSKVWEFNYKARKKLIPDFWQKKIGRRTSFLATFQTHGLLSICTPWKPFLPPTGEWGSRAICKQRLLLSTNWILFLEGSRRWMASVVRILQTILIVCQQSTQKFWPNKSYQNSQWKVAMISKKLTTKVWKGPTLPIESDGDEEITDCKYTRYIFRDTRTTSSDKECLRMAYTIIGQFQDLKVT